MKAENFKQYDFDNPHWLEKLVDKTIMKWFGCFFYRQFLNFIGIKGDENILDFGSGSGNLAKCILKDMINKGSLICLDTSTYWLNLAKKRLCDYKNVNFVNDDIRKADIQNNNFDIIYIYYVIHDINPKERQAVVEVIANKLKDNGKLYIGEPTKEKHGMDRKEIIYLMKKVDLKLEVSIENKSSFLGEFIKNKD
ncbi:MAG: class I SAM-dependent methyltransferase [Halanaerobiales bacterium]